MGMDKVVIGDYYHMTTMDENVNWITLTHLLSNCALDLRVLFFCTSTITSKFPIAFLNEYTREKQRLSLMYAMYANASNNTPSYTHV